MTDVPSSEVQRMLSNEDVVINVGPHNGKFRVQATIGGIVLVDKLFDSRKEGLDAVEGIALESVQALDALA